MLNIINLSIFQGTIVNTQVLAYLKYCIRSQLISSCGVFSALSTFKSFSSPNTLSTLLAIIESLLLKFCDNRLSDPVSSLCQSLITLTQWLFSALTRVIQHVNMLDVHTQPDMWNHQASVSNKKLKRF